MAGPDLTPEMLAQLEEIASRNMPRFDHHVSDATTMAKALPALVAAARERDQLRAQVAELEGIAHEFDRASSRADALRIEVASLRAPVLPVSEAAERVVGEMMAEARRTSTTRETTVRQTPERLAAIDRLEREVERLRGLGMEATTVLQALFEGEPWARRFEPKLSNLIAEIERKP